MARPSSLSPHAVAMLLETARMNMAGLALNDEELFHKMNKLLGRDERISYRTFQRYKATALACGNVDGLEEFDPLYEDLYEVLMDNRIAQKEDLMEKMMGAEKGQWIKYRWVMERKFADYNLRHQSEQFIRESKAMHEALNPKEEPREQHPPKQEPEPEEEEPAPFKMSIVDSEGNDWSAFADQQIRMNNARAMGVPFDEEPVPQPTPYMKPSMPQPHQNRMETMQMEDAWQLTDDDAYTIGDDPEWDTTTADDPDTPVQPAMNDPNEKSLPGTQPDNPWLKPDGTLMSNMEFMQAAKERHYNLFPHRPPQAPPAPPKSYPPGTKKILGFA